MGQGPHRFDPSKVERLLTAERQQMLPPQEILGTLGIQPGDDVADIGCGPGYFALPVAKMTQGTVYGVDVEPKMLEYLTRRAAESGVNNIRTIQSDAEQIGLPDQAVDKAIIAFVLHEVGDLGQALRELKRILRPGGQALLLEWEKKETESGPPLAHRLSEEELAGALHAAGFETNVSRPNTNHYMILVQ